eukprot:4399174-Pyramimonas_sp.AAC.1
MAPALPVGTPLTRFVALEGVPPKAPVAGSALHRRPIRAHSSHGSWPQRSSTKGPSGRVRVAPPP